MPKKANSKGIWISNGPHPPNILTPLPFCNFAISAAVSLCRGSLSLTFLYRALIDLISGYIRCIFTPLRMLAMRNSSINRLTPIVISALSPSAWDFRNEVLRRLLHGK